MPAGRENATVACFYFDFATQEEQSLAEILGSLLKQVVGGLNEVPHVETYYCESSVSHSHWNPPVFGKLFLMFDLYSGNTGCLEMEQTSTSCIL